MPDQLITFADFDRGGVVMDSDPFSLAPNEWSNCRNVRFDNRAVSKIAGESLLKATSESPQDIIYWEQPGATPDRYVYVHSGGVRSLNVADSTDNILSSTALSSTNPIQMSLFNGGATLLINDGDTTPQFIHSPDVSGSVQTAASLTPFPGWIPSGATYNTLTAKVVRPFRNVIVAANLTFSTVTNTVASNLLYGPSTIRVSNLAARGQMPTWDATYAGATTGDQFDLASNSPIIDMVELQDTLAVFTTDSNFLMRLTGNSTIPVAVTPGTTGRGMLTSGCSTQYYGRLLVVGNEDIYRYGGGSQQTSLVDSKLRDYFYTNLNRDALNQVNVINNRRESEVWICYPKGNSITANEALIFNYDYNTWSIRDLSNISGVTYGPIITDNAFDNSNQVVVMSDATNNRLIREDTSATSFLGATEPVAINAFVERRGLDVAPSAVSAEKWNDSTYYIIRGNGDVTVQVRPTNTPGQPVDFTSRTDKYLETRTFTLGTDGDYKVDYIANGRYYNTRIGTNDTISDWSLIRYAMSISIDDQR